MWTKVIKPGGQKQQMKGELNSRQTLCGLLKILMFPSVNLDWYKVANLQLDKLQLHFFRLLADEYSHQTGRGRRWGRWGKPRRNSGNLGAWHLQTQNK